MWAKSTSIDANIYYKEGIIGNSLANNILTALDSSQGANMDWRVSVANPLA
jgi:hypothetical protein